MNSPLMAIDIETTGLERDAEIVCAAIAWEEAGEIYKQSFWLDRLKDYSEDQDRDFREVLDVTLFNPNHVGTVLFHNLDFDIKFLLQRYFENEKFSSKNISRVSDTLTISRILRNNKYIAHVDPRRLKCHSLKFLAREYLGIQHTAFEDVVSGNIRFANRVNILTYNEKDAELTFKLYKKLKEIASPAEWQYVEEVEMPHLLNIMHMNWHGVPYAFDKARSLAEKITNHLNEIEKRVFINIGRSFNILSQQELASAIFYNHRLTYKTTDGSETIIHPLYVTDKNQTRVDLDTLNSIKNGIKKIDKESKAVETLNKIIQFIELSKALTFIETHMALAVKVKGGYVLYPNFSADAKSGRVKSSKPNLLGLPKKVFKKSDTNLVPVELKDESIRHLLEVPDKYQVASIDISALDLSVVTHGAKAFNDKFMWLNFFGNPMEPDIHFAVTREIDKARLEKAFEYLEDVPPNIDEFFIKKPSKERDEEGIPLFHKKTGEKRFCPYKKNTNAKEMIEKVRNMGKEANLSTSYMVGAARFAISIRKKLNEQVGADEAQKIVNGFYNAFPEIRLFQDQITNAIYANGFAQSVFGRKYYADCFDELNEQYHNGNDLYELICFVDGRYWYVQAHRWKKFDLPIVENLKVVHRPFGLMFQDITTFEELDPHTFRRSVKKKVSKFNRKSEDNQDEAIPFELSRISITNEVDVQIKLGGSISLKAREIVSEYVVGGNYLIPEKHILFYRVKTQTPSHKYFRSYQKFIKVARRFFPMYCQGIANSLASMCLTNVRQQIEEKSLDARILLFVHDEIDVMVNALEFDEAEEILKKSVTKEKPPFDVPLTGKTGKPARYIKSE